MKKFRVFPKNKLTVIFFLAAVIPFTIIGWTTKQKIFDPLPSWNDGPAKTAIKDFVHATTEKSSSKYVQPEDRIATFDQDGTLWVEHPLYAQVAYSFARIPDLVKAKPELKDVKPFKTVLSGDR